MFNMMVEIVCLTFKVWKSGYDNLWDGDEDEEEEEEVLVSVLEVVAESWRIMMRMMMDSTTMAGAWERFMVSVCW